MRAALLFADFPDSPGLISPDAWSGRVAPVVTEWYRQASYGRLTLSITSVPRWFRLGPLASYKADPQIGFNEAAFVRDAIAAADPVVDLSRVSIVYFIPPPTALTTPRMSAGISTRGSGLVVDGAEIRFTTGVGHGWSLELAPHVLIHETGHFFGLPDLYDELTGDRFRFAGVWDVMGEIERAAGFMAWHRWKLGWLDAGQLRCLRRGALEETLTPLGVAGGVKAIVVPTGPEAALVLENRQRSGEWAALCKTGVLAYTVVRLRPFTERGPIRVVPAAADVSGEAGRCGQLYAAPFTAEPGAPSSFAVAEAGVSVVLTNSGDGAYRVRVTRTATR